MHNKRFIFLYSNVFERNVLRCFINVFSELISLSSARSLFLNRGPATQKALAPNFLPVYLGSPNKLGS